MQILISFSLDNQNSNFLCLFKHSFSALNERIPICLSYIQLFIHIKISEQLSWFQHRQSWFSFMVSGMMLCFGFRRKTMLITQQCFGCSWAVLHRAKDITIFWASLIALPVRELRRLTEIGGNRIRTVDPNGSKGYSVCHRDIPFHVKSCKKQNKTKTKKWTNNQTKKQTKKTNIKGSWPRGSH